MNTVLLMLVPLLICLLLFWLTCQLLLDRSWIPGFLRGIAGIAFLFMTGVSALMAWDLKSFQDTSQPQPLAMVSFTQQDEQRWSVDVTRDNFLRPDVFEVRGDLWTFEAEHLSLDAGTYSLSYARVHSVQGRFLSLEQERGANIDVLVHSLHDPLYDINSWLLLEQVDRLRYIEATTVRAPFFPFRDGAIYEVWLNNGQLDMRPMNQAAKLMTSSRK